MDEFFFVAQFENESSCETEFDSHENEPMAPWLTPEIKRLMWERDQTKRIATVTNDQLKWTEYRRLKNRVNHSIEASKKAYYHSYFEDNVGKAKPTWNGINSLLSRKKNFAQATKLIIGEAMITDPHELSNAFNRHFYRYRPQFGVSNKSDSSQLS